MTIQCKIRLKNPQDAGAINKEHLKKLAIEYPHLRPCPKKHGKNETWGWIYRTTCEKCIEAVVKEGGV